MTYLVEQKRAAKPNLSTAQKTFNRLKRKVETLQSSLKETQDFLDEALQFYCDKLLPAEKTTIGHLTECIKIMYNHYKTTSGLSKRELKQLKELISYKIEEAYSSQMFKDADPELCSIYKDLNGVDYAVMVSDELTDLKSEMEEMFRDEGIDINLSEIDVQDDEHDIMQKLFAAMGDVHSRMKEAESKPQKKSKRDLEKEKKAQELETIQKKGLSTIYKQLAKALHPDLEQDPELKLEKETLMTKLTTAYDNNDLYTLLSLEMNWMSRSENGKTSGLLSSDEQLKIYNSLLKDQVEALEDDVKLLFIHPKYLHIHRYISDQSIPPMIAMHMALLSLESRSQEYRSTSQELQGKGALKTLREIFSAIFE